jgi:glucose-6-phosphate isomerase
MSQLDDRLLDHILETLKELVSAVGDLYQKQGVTDGEIIRLTEKVAALTVEIDRYKEEVERELQERKKEAEKLAQGDVDRKVDKGKYDLILKVSGAIGLIFIGAVIGVLI